MPSRASTADAEPPIPVRRSPRFLHTPKPRNLRPISSEPPQSSKRPFLVAVGLRAEVSRKSAEKSGNWGNWGSGSAKCEGLSSGLEGIESLRRSPRLVGQQKAKKPPEPTGEDGSSSLRRADPVHEARKDRKEAVSKKPRNWGDEEVNGFQEFSRSSRVSKNQKPITNVKKRDEEVKCMGNGVLSDLGNIIDCASRKSTRSKVLADARKVGIDTNLCELYKERAKGTVRVGVVNSELVKGGGEEKVREEKGREEDGVVRKRKRDKDCNGVFQGWTDKQEKALQRAYFSSKPTPHFWKKVAKLVPGKSAQECFDKIHSNNLTPPQHPPRSRAKKPDASSMDCSSLSASKLLLPTKLNGKRPISNRRKSHVAQKAVRHMLQKHHHIEEDYEADLFSVLEPNTNPSAPIVLPSVILSTPEHLQKKQGFLQKFCEKSSSGRKKPISRFSSSFGNALVSPPVLKQVKNRAMHEKYIDLLHCREAKRKAVSAREQKFFTGKEDPKECHTQKTDVVRAARVALVCEARDAIGQLRRLEANAMTNSSDLGDDEDASNDDDEGEDEP